MITSLPNSHRQSALWDLAALYPKGNQSARLEHSQRVRRSQHRYQQFLQAIAQVSITLNQKGLTLSVPGVESWEPDESYAQNFAELPEAFAQSYLRLRLRTFLLAVFCTPAACMPTTSHAPMASTPADITADNVNDTVVNTCSFANNTVGGGLHVGLIQQFASSNHGQGYFEPGWQVIGLESNGTLAVQKQAITVHIQCDRHLRPHHQSAQPGDVVDILLPGYRYEADDYIAVSNLGPVACPAANPLDNSPSEASETAIEIYFAANAAAMAPIMRAITTALADVIPYTLRVPHRIKDYKGAASITLRISAADYNAVRPVLKYMIEDGLFEEGRDQYITINLSNPKGTSANLVTRDETAPNRTAPDITASPQLRPEIPLFAYPLEAGISWASVLPSPVTHWYGSCVEASRMQLIAEALIANRYDVTEKKSSSEQKLSAIKTRFNQAGIDWQAPYRPCRSRP